MYLICPHLTNSNILATHSSLETNLVKENVPEIRFIIFSYRHNNVLLRFHEICAIFRIFKYLRLDFYLLQIILNTTYFLFNSLVVFEMKLY